jgi:hypothetical protein
MRLASRKPLGKGSSYFIRTNLSVLAAVTILNNPFLLADPAGASRTLTPQQTQTPLFAVGVARCTFVDRTRAVLNYSTTPPSILSKARTLVTEIRYPTQFRGGRPSPNWRSQTLSAKWRLSHDRVRAWL